MDPSTLAFYDLITKLGFAGLAIYLIFDTRKDAREREKRMAQDANAQNEQLVKVSRDSVKALEAVVNTTRELTAALKNRPCLIEDKEDKGKNRVTFGD